MEIVTGQANIDLIEKLFERDEKGFPLQENGEIDWNQTAIEKEEVLARYEILEARESGFKKFRKCNNAQRPKPRKNKKKRK